MPHEHCPSHVSRLPYPQPAEGIQAGAKKADRYKYLVQAGTKSNRVVTDTRNVPCILNVGNLGNLCQTAFPSTSTLFRRERKANSCLDQISAMRNSLLTVEMQLFIGTDE